MFKLLIAYDGGPFHGWQRQPDVATVQGEIEAALARMNGGEAIRLQGASRTDAGVHAEGQVAAFEYQGHIDAQGWHRGLNALTPDEITIRRVEAAPADFHPRFAARGKHYRFLLWTGCAPAPRWRRWAWTMFRPLDLDAMREAARHLLGEHDFTSFRAADCQAKTARRRITRVDIACSSAGWTYPRGAEEEALITLDFEGNAFLKYMIRIVTGTLVEVGLGQRSPESVAEAIAARDRRAAGRTAPPQGLTLVEVFFPPADAAEED